MKLGSRKPRPNAKYRKYGQDCQYPEIITLSQGTELTSSSHYSPTEVTFLCCRCAFCFSSCGSPEFCIISSLGCLKKIFCHPNFYLQRSCQVYGSISLSVRRLFLLSVLSIHSWHVWYFADIGTFGHSYVCFMWIPGKFDFPGTNFPEKVISRKMLRLDKVQHLKCIYSKSTLANFNN